MALIKRQLLQSWHAWSHLRWKLRYSTTCIKLFYHQHIHGRCIKVCAFSYQGIPLYASDYLSSSTIYGVGFSQIREGGLWCNRGQVPHWPTKDCRESSSCIPPMGGTGGSRGLPCKLIINPLIVMIVSCWWNACAYIILVLFCSPGFRNMWWNVPCSCR